MKIYTFTVALVDFEAVERTLALSGNCTFNDLHDLIFEAFERFDAHLYHFLMPENQELDWNIYDSSICIKHPVMADDDMGMEQRDEQTVYTTDRCKIRDLSLNKGDVFFYEFDMGDSWWHRIRVDSIADDPAVKGNRKIREIRARKGEAPPQYEEPDEN